MRVEECLAGMVLIFSLLVFAALAMIIHELGHLVAARSCRVRASELASEWARRSVAFALVGFA